MFRIEYEKAWKDLERKLTIVERYYQDKSNNCKDSHDAEVWDLKMVGINLAQQYMFGIEVEQEYGS